MIDCFLQKQDASVTYALRRDIKRLQQEYFAEISAPITQALTLKQPSFLSDPGFGELFRRVSEENEIVEHYVCGAPTGVMMRDAEGVESFLLVADFDTIMGQYAAAERHGAPADMLQLLRSRRAHSWFPTQEGLYHPDYAASWARFVWPAKAVADSSLWSYSFIRQEGGMGEQAQSPQRLTA
ncbi:MAG: hypothetical protein WDN31_08705 [Hyphomicrobium sp.]